MFFARIFLRVLNCFRAYGLLGFSGFQTGFTTFGSKVRNPAQKKIREGWFSRIHFVKWIRGCCGYI